MDISRPEVLNNLIRFRDNLLEMHKDEKGRGKEESRKYRVLLNRKTGGMRFAQKISVLGQKISRKGGKKELPEDWKEIQIIVKDDPAHFEMYDSQGRTLKESEIEPLAWRVSNETLNVLNQKAQTARAKSGLLLEEEALRDLSSIHLAKMFELIEEHPAWMGPMNRMDAEKILKNEPIGTYLLREGDEITISAAFHIAEENHLWIHPYILTVVEPDEKITDILLLYTDKGWTYYSDDPNLNDPEIYHYVPTLQELVQKTSLKPYKKEK